MPSTLVHVAFGAIIVTALLRSSWGWKPVFLLLFVVAAADLDTFSGMFIDGGHRSVGHTLLLPAGAAALLLVDTRLRERLPYLDHESWLARRYGPAGVEVAWVGVAAYLFAAIGLDFVMSGQFGGVNLLYPLHDQFYRLDGRAFYSTTDGFVQTFVEFTTEQTSDGGTQNTVDAGQRGTSEEVHISNPVEPEDGKTQQVEERIFPLVAAGWELWMVVTGAFTLAARTWQERAE